MRCSKCNQEIDENTGICHHCSDLDDNVRILSSEESSHYNGVTIETNHSNNDQDSTEQQYHRQTTSQKIYVRNFDFSRSNIISKIAIVFIIVAVIGFLLFIALPIVLIGICISIVVWFILSFLKR
ncbi:hypothetical protein [Anaerosinus massiliensis]|uniref:hypothetical protein n=1 Tax=Massilibacillus massiliensis TaxID=1806837 RepID=UPI000DA6182A|nr:hypothetical protein [Massilibacillus massiliensis]